MMAPERYDVERDVERARATRERKIADGVLIPDAKLRHMGGQPISDRAAVLIDHVVRSHLHAALSGRDEASAITTARRLVEYVGALEYAVFGTFSGEAWDDAPTMLGLAAASLEAISDTYSRSADFGANETTQQAVQAFRDVAARLRIVECRIADIPGHQRAAVQLPEVPADAPADAPSAAGP